jgi:hypothetical protein
VTRCWAGQMWFNSQHEQEIFLLSSPQHLHKLWGPAMVLTSESPRVIWPGHEADHSLVLNAEVKNVCGTVYPSDFFQSTWHHIPEYSAVHSHLCEGLKPNMFPYVSNYRLKSTGTSITSVY